MGTHTFTEVTHTEANTTDIYSHTLAPNLDRETQKNTHTSIGHSGTHTHALIHTHRSTGHTDPNTHTCALLPTHTHRWQVYRHINVPPHTHVDIPTEATVHNFLGWLRHVFQYTVESFHLLSWWPSTAGGSRPSWSLRVPLQFLHIKQILRGHLKPPLSVNPHCTHSHSILGEPLRTGNNS